MGSNIKNNCNIVYSCQYPVVWCPKYRRQVLINGVEPRLKKFINQTAQEFQATVIELEGMPDHAPQLYEANPQFSIYRLLRYQKGCSSRLLRQEIPRLHSRLPTLWTHLYFVATMGGAPLAVIKQYLENQKGV